MSNPEGHSRAVGTEPDATMADVSGTAGGGPEGRAGQRPCDPASTGEFLPASAASPGQTCDFAGKGAPTGGPGVIDQALLEGVVVPGYEILAELGRGGMGVVYKARHQRLGRLVALKMILAGAHAGAAGLARFKAEAEAVAKLQHPNIVQIYETGEHDGRPYFSLEFVEGGSLEQRLSDSPLTPRAAAELVEALARAMAFAHQRGIVHRDLKPANVLLAAPDDRRSTLEERGTLLAGRSLFLSARASGLMPKIADFGLAKNVHEETSQTASGAILGTPSYMAPEQAAGKTDQIGPLADVYSLGAIFYELLCGRPPFKAGSAIDTIRQVIEQEPVQPRQLEPRVPADLETVCLKCLHKEPGKRYAGAEELADDLRRWLDDKPILARPTSALERAWKWARRRPAVVALLGLCVLTAFALAGFVVWHDVSLAAQLEQARAEERQARRREQEAVEAERLSRLEAESERLFSDARLAATARDWGGARLHLTKALALVEAEPRLGGLKGPAQALSEQVEQQLRGEAEREAARERFARFGKLRDEAQFLGTLYTGMDAATNLKATRAAVLEALATYGVSVVGADAKSRPTLGATLSEAQRSEILADCYQLALVLAETEARSAPEQASPTRTRHLRQALLSLGQALRFGEPSRAYHLRRSRYLALLGDAAAARAAEEAAAKAETSHVVDHFLVADELYRRADFSEALASFDQVLRRNPGHFWAQYLSALCLLRLRRPAEARSQLGSCLAQRPDFVWLYLLRGFALGESSDYDAAEADFDKALTLPLDDYARYVLLVNRGVMRVRRGRLDDAVADLKKAVELKPSEYQAHVNLAQAYHRRKEGDLALAEMNQAVRLEPESAHVYRLRARLYLERKDAALALADFDQAIRRESPGSPHLADDHVERGKLLTARRKHAEALASFDAASRLRADHPAARRLRADCLFSLGRHEEALKAFDAYLEDDGRPLESVYRGRGLVRAELGDHAGAIDDYTRALELRPTSEVQAYRGWAHVVCEAPMLALRDFELAVRLDAKNADAHAGRAFVLAGLGKTRAALEDARTAVRLGPATPRLLYNAARVHALCGEAEQGRAVELLRQALALVPSEGRAAFWSAYVRKDAALAGVRRDPGYLRLEAETAKGR